MRLLTLDDDGGLALTADLTHRIPPYAILSHTWGDDEVTFKDITEGTGKYKDGYRKIEFCGQRAASDRIRYFWVDTCCIDKSSSTEVNEAIISMFRWYQKATRCYVYLSDVSKDGCCQPDDLLRSTWKSAFRKSRWFRRGWTLQELIAPWSVEFFSKEGQRLGDKSSLEHLVHETTGVAISALRGCDLSEFTVDERMSWSHGRETKREEDRAYSLLGIFKVCITPLYGEEVDSAFRRLEEEISKRSSNARDDNERTIRGNGEAFTNAEMRKELLDLFYFDDIDTRRLTLKKAHNRTCRWFLHTEQYKTWMSVETLRDHRGFLWIKGKPGAGKSILMNFLYDKAKAAKPNTSALVMSFFFNARGGDFEKSTVGLYRSLLWQLLKKTNNLQEVLHQLDANARHIIQRNDWPLEILKQTLAKAIECLGHRTLQLFIDALDECHDDDVADMISFFEDIGERAVEANVRLHICFSSRHYPTVVIRWGIQITLENEDEHYADITRYITSTLKLDNPSRTDGLRSQILEKSAGVFLWVALVIPMLNRAYAEGRVNELQKCLDDIPPGLDALFEMILTRDCENIEDFQLCVQWILFAKRPLKLDEYYLALNGSSGLEMARSWSSGGISSEVMNRFALSSSKGLAEVTKTKSKDKTATVQFIHESVRTFFLTNSGYQKLWPRLNDQFFAYSHEILKSRCLAEINACIGSSTLTNLLKPTYRPREASSQTNAGVSEHVPPHGSLPKASSSEASTLRQSMSEALPFLKYAVHHVLYHADTAESHPTIQEIFLKQFPLNYWILFDNLFERYQIRRHTPRASLLYILAEKNLAQLVKDELRRVPNMDIPGERHYFPMFAACINGNREAITALLIRGIGPQSDPNLVSQLDSLCQIKPQTRTPLSVAAERGHENIVKLLLEMGKVDADSKDIYGWTPLAWAAENGHDAIVKLLLETGKVDADSKDIYDWTPLAWAAENGHDAVVKLLLETGKVDADSKDIYGWTSLTLAAEKGHDAVVKLLLETGKVDADSKDIYGWTPLILAAENGHDAVVKLLLETGKVDTDSKDIYGWTPLAYAAEKGHDAVVKLLQSTVLEAAGISSRNTAARGLTHPIRARRPRRIRQP